MDAKNIHVRGERSTGAQRRKRKEMCCNFCAQRGHFARNCPDITCWECGKKGHEKKSCFVKFFRLFTIWNKRMNWWSMMWMKNWQNVINKRKIENERKKDLNKEEIGKSNDINETKKEKNQIDMKDINDVKKKEIMNDDVKNGVIKVEKDKIVNEKKDIEMINKISHQKELIKIDDSNINQKIINLNNNKKINNNKKKKNKNESKANVIKYENMRSKVKRLKRRICSLRGNPTIKFCYKEDNILNINGLYDININDWDDVYILKEIDLLEFFELEELNHKLIFDRDIILNANASDYEKCIREIINKLLKLKREDKIDIKLHIIDNKINAYITYRYKSLDYISKMKDRWLWYDLMEQKWYYISNMKDIDGYSVLEEIAFIN